MGLDDTKQLFLSPDDDEKTSPSQSQNVTRYSSEITWTSHVAECYGTTELSLSLQDPCHWIFLHS